MKNFDYTGVRRLVEKSRKIVITSHHNPDGDAIGSTLALYHFLLPFRKELHMVVPNDFPGFLKWMPGNEEILRYERKTRTAGKLLKSADLVFCLDYNALHRTADMAAAIRESPAIRVLIDHHPEPVLDEFHHHFSKVETSSTAELVYDFIRGMAPGSAISLPTAQCLFVGIMTDTGSFSYACNYPETFSIAAELVRAGVDAEKLHRLVYDTYSEDRLRLLGYSLSNKMQVVPELKTAYIALTREELERFNYQVGDTEGVVNYALSIDGVIIAILLTGRKDRIRISFRSKGNFAVNRIARDHFEGGGHMNAAGGDSFDTMDNTISKLLHIIGQFKEEIDRCTY